MPITDNVMTSHRRFAEQLGKLRHDLAVALRTLRRAPTFAAAAIAILALGVGASTAMFVIYKSVLVDELPVRAQDRLVIMHPLDRGGAHLDVPYPFLQDIARDSTLFRGAAGLYHLPPSPSPFLIDNTPVVLSAASASPNFFSVFGVRPAIGRMFVADDGRTGALPVIVLSYRAWRRVFDGDSAAIGRTAVIPYTMQAARIVGVAPPGFDYPSGADAWVPLPAEFTAQVDIIARMAPGVTIDAARDGLFALIQRRNPFATIPAAARGSISELFQFSGVDARSFADTVLGKSRPAIIALTLAVALLLFIACMNAGNLVLVRLLGRTREIAVRRAIGASFGDVARLFFIENALLGVAGGVLGLATAVVLLRVMQAAAPAQLPRADALGLAGAPALAAAGITVAVTLLFGLVPSVIASRVSSYAALRADSHTGQEGRSRRTMRRWLVAVQVALSVVLLTGAALLVRTLDRLQTMNLGYTPEHLSMLSFTGPRSVFTTPGQIYQVAKEVEARIEATPGVIAATPIESSPFEGQSFYIMKVAPADVPKSDALHYPFVPFEFVGPGYFRTFGVAIRRGRPLQATDTKAAQRVVVASETLAHHLWPKQSAVGKQLRTVSNDDVWTVVGVAADTHLRELRAGGPVAYFNSDQVEPFWNGYVAIRTTRSLSAMLPTLRAAAHDANPNLLLWNAATMDQLLDQPLAQPRMSALLMSAFGVVALLLSGLGLYGVMSAAVRRQTRDIGIRVALGATGRDVRRLVLRDAAGVVAAGAVAGALAAILAARLLASQLFGVRPLDPVSLISAVLSLIVIGVCAAYLPARRAVRIDPMQALRSE